MEFLRGKWVCYSRILGDVFTLVILTCVKHDALCVCVCVQVEVIQRLLTHDHHSRPSAKDLLQSHLLPLKMEDEQLEEVLSRTMQVSTSVLETRFFCGGFSLLNFTNVAIREG